jgi:hypothetical protein
MKEKEIRERIKQTALNEMPDVYEKINLNNIQIEPRKRREFNFNFARNLKIVFTSFVLIVTGFFVYNFILNNNIDSNTPLASDMELLGFQTISGSVLLGDLEAEELSYDSFSNEIISLSSTTESISIDTYIDDINPLVHMMETILNSSSDIEYKEFDSDDEFYQYAFSYKSYDLAKNEVNFKIYYNKTNEDFEGKVIIEDKMFEFDKDSLRLQVRASETNYINIENKSTDLQQTFKYSLYQDNELVLENDLELYRIQKNIQVRTRVTKNGVTMNLYFQRMYMNNLDELEVDYEIEDNQNRISGNFRIDLEFDQVMNGYHYRYVFSNNSTTNKPRGPFANPGNSPHM